MAQAWAIVPPSLSRTHGCVSMSTGAQHVAPLEVPVLPLLEELAPAPVPLPPPAWARGASHAAPNQPPIAPAIRSPVTVAHLEDLKGFIGAN